MLFEVNQTVGDNKVLVSRWCLEDPSEMRISLIVAKQAIWQFETSSVGQHNVQESRRRIGRRCEVVARCNDLRGLGLFHLRRKGLVGGGKPIPARGTRERSGGDGAPERRGI